MQCNPWFNARSPHHDLWLTNSWADSRMTILFSSGLKNWWVLSPTENEKTGNYCTQSVPRISAKLTRMHWFFYISATHRSCFSKDQIWSLLFLFFSLHKTIFGREAGAFIRKINVWTILFLALQKCCNVLQYCRVFRLQFLKGLSYRNVLFIVSNFFLHKSIEPNPIKFVSPAPCLHWQEFSASYAFKFSPLRSSYRIPSRYSSPVLKSGNILSPFPLLIIIKSPLIRDLKYVATFHFRKRIPIL